MKRCFVFIAMAALLFCALPALAKSAHYNHVYFEGTDYLNFTLRGFYVSHGQPWDGVSCSYGGDTGEITVHAGRHGTDEPAHYFNHRVDLSIGTRHIGDIGSPDKLNFAIRGDLALGGNNGGVVLIKDILIGQGHVGAYNNWWLGAKSEYIKEVGGKVWLECPPADGGYVGGIVLLETHESDTFKVTVRNGIPNP